MEAGASKTTRSSGGSKESDATTSDREVKASEGELPEYEAALDVGYMGVATDTRPNEDYTVAGVVARAEEGPPNIANEADPLHPTAEQQ